LFGQLTERIFVTPPILAFTGRNKSLKIMTKNSLMVQVLGFLRRINPKSFHRRAEIFDERAAQNPFIQNPFIQNPNDRTLY
jgi:hypothetical protein